MGAFLSTRPASDSNHTTVHFASKPAVLTVKKTENPDQVEHLSLRELLETRCTSLFTAFSPLWWLPNGHLQTIYCVTGDFSGVDRMLYRRQYLRLVDGGTLGIDFTPIDGTSVKDDAPIIVVQHGLTGGSYEAYVRVILSRACAPVEKGGLGYRAVVINFRGCAGVPITNPLFYSAGHTDDTRNALMYVANRYPKARLLGLGFSLGANVITRYLGEEREMARLHSACVLACPWDLQANNHGLRNSFFGRYVYSRGMGGNLQNVLKRHAQAMTVDPSHPVAKAAMASLALRNPTLDEFDQSFTRIAGGPSPSFPFPNVDEYYFWGSSHRIIKDIAVPFLAINAADDPIVKHVPSDGGGNGLIVLGLTKGGGHLGWFQAGQDSVDRWTTRPVLEWLKLVGEELVIEPLGKGSSVYTDVDGFLRERERDHLGCKEIDGGGVIDGNGGEGGILQGL